MEGVWSALELSWAALGGLLAPYSHPQDREDSPREANSTRGGRNQEGGNKQIGKDPRAPGLLDRDPIAPGLAGKAGRRQLDRERDSWTEEKITPRSRMPLASRGRRISSLRYAWLSHNVTYVMSYSLYDALAIAGTLGKQW